MNQKQKKLKINVTETNSHMDFMIFYASKLILCHFFYFSDDLTYIIILFNFMTPKTLNY